MEKWSGVKLPAPLADKIDEIVESEKDEYGIKVFKSRADFVARAARYYIKSQVWKRYAEEVKMAEGG